MGAGREKKEKEGLPLPPVSSRFFFIRAFSIPRARLSRSLEQATINLNIFFDANVVIAVVVAKAPY